MEAFLIRGKKMIEYIVPIFALLLIFLVPFVVWYAFFPKYVEKPLQWYFGLFAIGMFFLCLYVLKIPLLISQCIGLSAVVLCAGMTIRRVFVQRHTWKLLRAPQIFPSVVVYGCTLILLLYSFSDIYANPITGQDGIVIWFGKAKVFYFWNPFTMLPFVRYPPIGSMLWALVMMIFGFHESYGRFIYPIAYVMFILFLWSSMKVKKYKLLFSLYMMTLLFLFFRPSFYSGYQDDFLSITGGLATALFILYMFDMKKSYRYLLACFFAGFLGLIKSEGVLLSLIIMLNVLLVYFGTIMREWQTKSLFYISGVLIFFFVLGFWTFLISLYGIDPTKIQGDQITFRGILDGYQNINRIQIIGPYLLDYFWNNPIFILILIVSLITAVVRPYARKSIVFLFLIIGIHTASIIWVYFATTAPLVWHLETSFSRLMDQHASLFLLLSLFCFQLLLPNKKPYQLSV